MNGNVSQTAEKLFIHRNTLQYRFRKIKEITGFDIYHIDDLVQLRLAVLQYRYFGI
jgi:carbohydrate diacid regulator